MRHRPRLTAFATWLVTGPLARGFAFAIDFAAALTRGAAIALRGLTRR